jgi:hypothetical protein
MSAVATIVNIHCVKEASGTDLGSLSPALQEAFNSLLPRELPAGQRPGDVVAGFAGLITAIDEARSDPDNLYITTNTEGVIANSIWPGGGATQPLQASQSVQPQIDIDFENRVNLSLWDEDGVFDSDDLLGSITIEEAERDGGEITRFAYSKVESSAYYITYTVS